jgi:hypothetical protein
VDLWRDWFNDISNRQLPGNIVGIRARAPTIARKVALLYGWDFGPAMQGQPWQMDLDVLEPAIAFSEMHVKSLITLAEVIADHPDARLRRTVLDVLKRRGGEATLGDILLDTKMKKRPIAEMLDAMVESYTIAKLNTPMGTVFRII